MFALNITNSGMVTIYRCCPTHKERIGAYGMLNNPKCSESGSSEALFRSCHDNILSRRVLCIQDMTEFNYNAHIDRIGKSDKGIGPIIKDSHAGFFCHPMLAIDPLHIYAGSTSDGYWYDDESLYRFGYEDLMEHIDADVNRGNEDFIKHYNSKYDNPPMPPSWMALEVV